MPLRHPVVRFSLAIVAVALTTWANFYIQVLTSNQIKPLPYFPVLVVVTYYTGLLPALLYVILAAIALDYWWLEPTGSLRIAGSADVYVLLFFLLASGAIIAVSNSARRLVASLRLGESRLDAARISAARMDASLRESEESLRLALEGARLGMWARDLTSDDVGGTARCYEILGLPPDSPPLSAERWRQSIHPDDLTSLTEAARTAIENRGSYEHQFRVVRRDGSIGWVESRARVLCDRHNVPARLVGILIDITDRKEAEAGLRESSRRKDEFLAILAHELRNPLAPIRYAGRMLKMPISGDKLAHVGNMIERQLAHMTRLLDDLLDTSRVSRGVLELRREPLDFRAAIEAAIDATRPSFENSGQTLLARISASPLPVDGDRVRLTQAVGNLLDNASKYSDSGTQIEIDTRETAEEVIVEVRDQGIGIPPELLPSVFELFTQGNHGTARSKGLGIGLALSQQLVTLHGGRIEAHSDGPGRGSRFVLILPRLAPAAVTPGAPTPLPQAVRDARGMRILIADDNVDGADALAQVLEQADYSTQVAYDGISALTLAETFRPHIALLDIGLPNITGLELARRIRAQSWGTSIRLIAVTGWGQESDRRESAEAGFDEHLTKPVDPDQLLISMAGYAEMT